MRICKAILTAWMVIAVVIGSHAVPLGHAPPMPWLYLPSAPYEALPVTVVSPPPQQQQPGGGGSRSWHRPALASAAAALEA